MGKAPGLHPGPWLLFVLFVGGRFTVRLFHNGNLFSNCFFEIELPTILVLAMLKKCRWVVLNRFSQLKLSQYFLLVLYFYSCLITFPIVVCQNYSD